ncbi:NnrU family protein [Blastomonas sp.]|uniref:NnrU family protein n=1 Tax=Blastomonas sp. TaxID=1909299 RepID=UPI0026019EA1|nr:NnrU family protein [Blastomonas sp.]MDM7956939.1 NnrU family protein [Blastomonas sp.]
MQGYAMLLAGAVGFVGSHFAMSHPLRAPMVARLGDKGFQLVYTLVSFVTLFLMVQGFQRAPVAQPFWPAGDGVWAVSTVLMLVASILFAGSLIGNPALPVPEAAAKKIAVKDPAGVFRITRHPMMWSFALWGVSHILVAPRIDSFILCGAIIVLALVGSRMQDRKKFILMGDAWLHWQSHTSFVPFGRGFAFPGWIALIGGVAFWIAGQWAHQPLGAGVAGVFRWW